mmetsp:Transcript_37263/g.57791  ORF Transcript_37263/g.57791 Transcript_37263/m.57791 type:complete len:226 (+) Transcript_37263:135-812(+)
MLSITALLQLPRICNDNGFLGGTRLATNFFDFPYDVQSVSYLTENHVFAIQPRRFLRTKEELRSICIRACICHTQYTRASVFQFKIFIWPLLSKNPFSSSSIVSCKITSLTHEAWNDPVESGPLEMKLLSSFSCASLSGAKTSEILSSLWNDIGSKLHFDSTSRFPPHSNIEVNDGIVFSLPFREGFLWSTRPATHFSLPRREALFKLVVTFNLLIYENSHFHTT